MIYTVKSGQDLLDLSIQEFGDIESGLFQILADNPSLNLGSSLASGQKLTLNNENIGVVSVKNYFESRNFNINNADALQLSTNVGGFSGGFSNGFNNITL